MLAVADRELHDAEDHGYETRTVSEILKYSSNIGAVLIARKVGTKPFDAWIHRWGFGKPTGVDLPGEEQGIVLPLEQYSGATMGNLPIGQGIAVTPMQMAAAYAAIANGGILRPPHIVASVGGQADQEAGRQARDLRGDRRVGAQDARGRARRGRHGVRRRDPRLRPRGQDRHGREGDQRRVLEGQVRRVVRRLRSGQAPQAARRR